MSCGGEDRFKVCIHTCTFVLIDMQMLYVERMWMTPTADLSRNEYEIVDN